MTQCTLSMFTQFADSNKWFQLFAKSDEDGTEVAYLTPKGESVTATFDTEGKFIGVTDVNDTVLDIDD